MYRSRSDVMLGGVCSGIAKYLEVDVTMVRLVFLVLLFIGMGGLWIYLILWVIMPQEPSTVGQPMIEVKPIPDEKPITLVKEVKATTAVKQVEPVKKITVEATKKATSISRKPVEAVKKPSPKKPTNSK